MQLPPPFDTFRLEMKAGEYKDFHVSPDNPYPLKGVTYPVNYGDIKGYTGEDKHDLDIFVGENGNIFGYFRVYRPDVDGDKETKFYLFLTDAEEKAVFDAFESVLLDHGRYESIEILSEAVEKFKNK